MCAEKAFEESKVTISEKNEEDCVLEIITCTIANTTDTTQVYYQEQGRRDHI